jgi:hypothetical protein
VALPFDEEAVVTPAPVTEQKEAGTSATVALPFDDGGSGTQG